MIRDVTAPSITAAIQPGLAPTVRPTGLHGVAGRVVSLRHVRDAGRRRTSRVSRLETQTITLTQFDLFTRYGQDVWDPSQLHELSHMWFGDSVSPYSWSDLWLNEGHASWYEFAYAEDHGQLSRRHGGRVSGSAGVCDARRADARDLRARRRVAQEVRACGAARKAVMSSSSSASRCTTAVHWSCTRSGRRSGGWRSSSSSAAWVQRNRGGVGEHRRLHRPRDAGQRGQADVAPFLREWLYAEKTPPMPGHPDWTVNPVGSITTTSTEPVHGHHAYQP